MFSLIFGLRYVLQLLVIMENGECGMQILVVQSLFIQFNREDNLHNENFLPRVRIASWQADYEVCVRGQNNQVTSY